MTCLLAIIYLAFISLGLPDTMLGSAWPEMHLQLAVPVSYAGIISMLIATGTVIASLTSDLLTRRLGTGRVTALSVALTAAALLGFSLAPSFWVLCLIALPYGLGAGAVDVALNNYVAIHFHARHMSWLHCFWGIGATLGPYIMGACLTGGWGWHGGYRTVGFIQLALTACLFLTLPLWRGARTQVNGASVEQTPSPGALALLRLPGVKADLLALFAYQGLEQTIGLWAASFMVMARGISAQQAATWAALFYLGMTLGRLLSGFLTLRFTDQAMVRLGQGVTALGILLTVLPLGHLTLCAGLLCLGLGCAPIYPSLLHETPSNFGIALSQAVMGLLMACAYVGTTLLAPVFGLIAQNVSIRLFPAYLLLMLVIMTVSCEVLNRKPKHLF